MKTVNSESKFTVFSGIAIEKGIVKNRVLNLYVLLEYVYVAAIKNFSHVHTMVHVYTYVYMNT